MVESRPFFPFCFMFFDSPSSPLGLAAFGLPRFAPPFGLPCLAPPLGDLLSRFGDAAFPSRRGDPRLEAIAVQSAVRRPSSQPVSVSIACRPGRLRAPRAV